MSVHVCPVARLIRTRQTLGHDVISEKIRPFLITYDVISKVRRNSFTRALSSNCNADTFLFKYLYREFILTFIETYVKYIWLFVSVIFSICNGIESLISLYQVEYISTLPRFSSTCKAACEQKGEPFKIIYSSPKQFFFL